MREMGDGEGEGEGERRRMREGKEEAGEGEGEGEGGEGEKVVGEGEGAGEEDRNQQLEAPGIEIALEASDGMQQPRRQVPQHLLLRCMQGQHAMQGPPNPPLLSCVECCPTSELRQRARGDAPGLF